MQRIIISESDLTSNVEIMSSYDVAYVPGFMSASDNQLEKYYRKPTLFTNKYEFLAKIGNIAPKFAEAQPYPTFVNGEQNGFTKKAIPADGIMFPAGDADLGYRIALYLLNLGIPVYYEVMNNTLQGDLATYYTYKKVDLDGGDTFIDGLSYYEMADGHSSDSTVSVTNTDISPVPSITKATFITKVGSENTGFYTFTGVATGNVVSWTVNDDDTTITATQMTEQYGISFTGWTPVDGETYTLVVFYESATDDEITQIDIAPDTTDSWFTKCLDTDGNPITSFDSEKTYYTLQKRESCPISVEAMYDGLAHRFIEDPDPKDSSFDSVGDYSVKFITSGGYPTFEYCFKSSGTAFPLMTGMIDLAAKRGDAVALIDHTNNPDRDVYPSTLGGAGNAVIDVIRSIGGNIKNGDFGAMFTPWYECSHGAIAADGSAFVPASVGYLSALAIQLRDYNPWLAVSGVTRGRVPNLTTSATSDTLHTVQLLTNNVADSYQALPTDADISQISINPITYIRNVGYCIWGNRTLRNNSTGTSALSFLNVRGLVSDIKKLIYEASQTNLFEQNTDITWINFKAAITPLLDRMTANYVLQDYSITRYLIDPVTGENVPSYKVLAVIRIRPINSIEVFDLTVQLENAEVVVAEI